MQPVYLTPQSYHTYLTLLNRGVYTVTCFHDSFCGPVGSLWFTASGSKIQSAMLMDIYVPTGLRKLGIGRRLMNELFEKFDIVTTSISDTSSDGGNFVSSLGFTKQLLPDLWVWNKTEEKSHEFD